MNDKIADRLDGMETPGGKIKATRYGDGSITISFLGKSGSYLNSFTPVTFVETCRMVVERVQEKCRWKQDDTGDWFTRCGEGWTFTDGGVAENRIKFCPYCGKPIEAVEYKEPMEEI